MKKILAACALVALAYISFPALGGASDNSPIDLIEQAINSLGTKINRIFTTLDDHTKRLAAVEKGVVEANNKAADAKKEAAAAKMIAETAMTALKKQVAEINNKLRTNASSIASLGTDQMNQLVHIATSCHNTLEAFRASGMYKTDETQMYNLRASCCALLESAYGKNPKNLCRYSADDQVGSSPNTGTSKPRAEAPAPVAAASATPLTRNSNEGRDAPPADITKGVSVSSW